MAKIFDNCPVPDLRRYEFGESVQAVITSVLSAEGGLFYFMDEVNIDHFSEIGSFKPTVQLKTPPAFGELFLYVNHDRKAFRAYRLSSNPANFNWVRFFLIDVGVLMFIMFAPNQFYSFPDHFDVNLIEPMAIFCRLEEIPRNETILFKSEFLETFMQKPVTFKILREIKVDNEIGKRRFCLGVRAEITPSEQQNTDVQATSNDDSDGPEEIDLKLTYTDEHSSAYIPMNINQVSQAQDLPALGSMIALYEFVAETSNTLWACIRTQMSFTEELLPDNSALHRKMNVPSVVKQYQKLKETPAVGDMVIAAGVNRTLHRGLIKRVINTKCHVFFVDFGYSLEIHNEKLCKFPKEFATMPFQAVRITIANLEESSVAAMRRICSHLKQTGSFARVLSVQSSQPFLAITADVYDRHGTNATELFRDRLNI